MIDYGKTQVVAMHETAVTHAGAQFHTLATIGAGPCHVVSMYNADAGIASLSHVDDHANIRSLRGVFQTVSRQHANPVRVIVEAGNPDSEFQGDQLVAMLRELPNAQVEDRRNRQGHSLFCCAIDARCGTIARHHQIGGEIRVSELDQKRVYDLDPGSVERGSRYAYMSKERKTPLAMGYDGLAEANSPPPAPAEPRRRRQVLLSSGEEPQDTGQNPKDKGRGG